MDALWPARGKSLKDKSVVSEDHFEVVTVSKCSIFGRKTIIEIVTIPVELGQQSVGSGLC